MAVNLPPSNTRDRRAAFMSTALPERLNFAIARRCPVECPGCYEVFGRTEPDRAAFVRSAASFASCGVTALTLSGGDPLLLPRPLDWIADFRAAGMLHVKLDTVALGLLAPSRADAPTGPALLAAVDLLSIPLDGWNDDIASMFRRGPANIHTRTVKLLHELDAAAAAGQLVINTVVHAGNVEGLARMAAIVLQLKRLGRWNLFQYASTDQAKPGANDAFAISHSVFVSAIEDLRATCGDDDRIRGRSVASRLGDYLLINSDGQAWLPDALGNTIALGLVFSREAEVLLQWSAIATKLRLQQART